MAKKQKSTDSEQERDFTENIQKRLEKLLPQKADIPASLSIQQAEELKARVLELEAQLEAQPGMADKKTATAVQKTDTPPFPSPQTLRDGVSKTQASGVNIAFLLSILLSTGHFLAALYYLYEGRSSELSQFYPAIATSFALAALYGVISLISRQRRSSLALILVPGMIAAAYPPLALLVMEVGLVAGLVLVTANLVIAIQTLPRRFGWMMVVITAVSAAATLLLDKSALTARPSLPAILIPLVAIPMVGLLAQFLVRQFRTYPLRTRLITSFLFLTTVPLIILGSQTYATTHDILEEQIKAEILRSSVSSGTEYQEFLDSQFTTLRSQARATEIIQYLSLPPSERNNAEQESLVYDKLKTFSKNKPSYIKSFALLDPNGMDVLDTNKSRIGTSFAGEKFFTTVTTIKQPFASGLSISPKGGNNIYFAAPITSKSGELLGVYVVAYNPEILQSMITQMIRSNQLAPAASEYTYVIEADNYFVLAHTVRVDQLFKTYLDLDDPRLVKLQEQGVISQDKLSRLVVPQPEIVKELSKIETTTDFQAPSYTGELTESAAVHLSNADWIVVVSRPTSTITDTIQSQTRANVTTSAIIIIFVSLFALLASGFFTAPIIQLTRVAEKISAGDLTQKAEIHRRDEIGVLARTFNSMTDQIQALVSGLEQRVEDRTHDLELASEVGRTIAERVENLSGMLTEATEVIRSRFNLYYTQVYLVDASGETITLRAGTGDVGRQLLQRRHRLPLSSNSLNSRAVLEKKPVIVADTQISDTFLPNPLLPDTRSEMAIPLLAGDKVLGVLDMQSEIPNKLNEENIAAFEVLAGQLSVAIQNANLFAQSEEARTQIETNVRRVAQTGWQDFLNAIERGEKIGYAFNQREVIPLEDVDGMKSTNALNVPILVTGADVGAIQLVDEQRKWTAQETEIVQAAAIQLAQHLDNLRLLAQAERYRSEAEQAVRRLTREGWERYSGSRQDHVTGFMYNLNQVLPLRTNGHNSGHGTITQALSVRDETFGELAVEKEGMSEEAREIVAAVAQQLSGHIENLRLSEQIEKRAAELQTVATLSSTTSTLLDPDILLQTVVDLTKERFGLYHAHVYLASDSWNTLLLAAGAGDVGRQMVSEGWNIPMDHEQSIVASAARTRQSVIANDLVRDANSSFLSNRLLPDTRSEMAVPMIVGDQVLGVFDVQADRVDYFSAEDANIFTTLAAQIAVALQNARLYVEQAATVTQLRELDKLKSSFLANMSHELRTPLNSILGFTDVILEGLDGSLTEHMDNDLRLIQKNGQHLLHLINDVLDMAKIESGRMNLNPETFKVHEVIDEVVSITSTLASEKNLSLFLESHSDGNVQIYADRTRLRQVMINLVNNSIKFTDRGNVALCVAPMEGARVLITVKDTGIGVPPDKLEAIFQEFTQVDSSTTRKTGGTGLGLPISRRLVEMHGGRLWAESTGVSGEGSAFFVELPLEARISEVVEKQER